MPEDIAVKTLILKTALITLAALCLTAITHAQDYQPPALYRDTATLQKFIADEPKLVRARFQDDLTLLHFAAMAGDTTGMRLLLDKGSDVNAADKSGQTPLHKVRSVSAAELLLAHGADAAVKDKDGRTPFDMALTGGHNGVARLLAKYAIFPAMTSRDSRTVQRILYAFPEVLGARDKDGATPLHYAADEGSKPVCELFISAGADVNARKNDGVTPLHIAATLGKTEIVRLLLDHGADPNVKDTKSRTPLSLAVEHSHKDTAQLLREAMGQNAKTPAGKKTGASRTSPPHTDQSLRALFLAIMQDNLDGVTDMLSSDPSLAKAADQSGMTGLMVAVDAGKNDVAKLLVAKGADVNAKDNSGATALFHAVSDLDLAKLLVSKGADVKARSNDRRTPLHQTASFGAESVASFLISKGADVNAKDIAGKTPLDLAAQSPGRPEMVALLRRMGAK